MRTVNIIGCGNVGKTLGHLWAAKKVFRVGDILNRSVESSTAAVAFMRAGRAISSIEEMTPADVFMISTSDGQIADCCRTLVARELLRPGDIVFHCSGALSSRELAGATTAHASIASVHPVKSFAAPERSVTTFEGTYCGVEGDPSALAVLEGAFEGIGGKTFTIDPDFKTIYHAATVIVCNYLTALLELGISAYAKSGLPRETALQVMEPIVRGTLDNIFNLGTVQALTGPIARGDHTVVAKQLHALTEWNQRYGELYRDLGAVALDLARSQGSASEESLSAISNLLERP